MMFWIITLGIFIVAALIVIIPARQEINEISNEANKVTALLKEVMVVSKPDGSKMNEDERFVVLMAATFLLGDFLVHYGTKKRPTYRFHIMENGCDIKEVRMQEFVNLIFLFQQEMLGTFSDEKQELFMKMASHEINAPEKAKAAFAYLDTVDYNNLIHTNYKIKIF